VHERDTIRRALIPSSEKGNSFAQAFLHFIFGLFTLLFVVLFIALL